MNAAEESIHDVRSIGDRVDRSDVVLSQPVAAMIIRARRDGCSALCCRGATDQLARTLQNLERSSQAFRHREQSGSKLGLVQHL